ncbi:MAG: rhomboid family intramembrane serine protease [Bacteroidota bacterium]
MFSFLNNIPTVTRNLLILNVLMFILTAFFETQGIDLREMLSIHAINSPFFEPYQIVSHFFMHGDFMHLFMNMFGLLMFGAFLEKLWGAKRFFIFFFAASIGSWLIDGTINYIQFYHLKNELIANGFTTSDFSRIHAYLLDHPGYLRTLGVENHLNDVLIKYQNSCLSSSLGASGGLFGILAAFAILFPNTELQFIFFPIPIKAKFLIGAYVAYELYMVFNPRMGDNIGHLAHIGGAVVGAILVLIWRKNRNQFY